MRVALVQVASPDAEPVAERRARVGELVSSISGADLVVLPELWGVGYFAFDRYAASAEPLDGPTVALAGQWARELDAHVHLGSVVEDVGSGEYANTAVVLDPGGARVLDYRKVHVFGYRSREAQLLRPGTHLRTADTRLGRIGTTTCYDLRFPEIWRSLVDAGAELVIVPAAWPAARREHWRLFTAARAVEEQVFVIAANAAGGQQGVQLAGTSRVVGPGGELVVEAGDEECVTYCDIDVADVRAARAEFPVLADRLPSYDHLRSTDHG